MNTSESLIEKLEAEKVNYAETQDPGDLAYNTAIDHCIDVARNHKPESVSLKDAIAKYHVANHHESQRQEKECPGCRREVKMALEAAKVDYVE